MVNLKENKHRTEHKQIESIPAPKRAYISLNQQLKKSFSPLVKAGDQVLKGQKIASIKEGIYSAIHSPISGKIFSIQDSPHQVLGKGKAIIIDNDFQEKSVATYLRTQKEIDSLDAQELRAIIRETGIVGLGGAGFPSYIKLTPPRPIHTLIINGAECEPYLTCDYRIMLEKTEEIILGIGLIARCLGAKDIYIGIEDNKPKAIEKFRSKGQGLKVKVLKSFYPQGGEKQIIKNITNNEVERGKLPFDSGVVVQNVGTALSIYEAVYLNKPLFERVMTVTGSCLVNPKNLKVCIGTPIKELIDFCGPLKENPAKIVIGGPMMGIAQNNVMTPVIKSTTGVILFNKKEAQTTDEEPCIRCAACVRECPVGLMPCMINLASIKQLWPQAKDFGALDCIECGLCSYVCPANRRLVQSIKMAKLEAIV
ncbi:MAG: electron transport complex subunit RsxC [Candidatus Omnitrophota bacterium]|nr:electron transport complex subunit RsxC [Candidatus Omnitrophota bacterium]